MAINYCFINSSYIIDFNIILILDYLLVCWPLYLVWRILWRRVIGNIILTFNNSNNRFFNEFLFFVIWIGLKRSIHGLILNFSFFLLSWVCDLVHEGLEREYFIGLDVDILNVDRSGAGLIDAGF